MTSNMPSIDHCAQLLDDAAVNAVAIAPAQQQQEISMADAYRIQQALLARRLARGEHMVGLKMGFTSAAKMAQMGVSDQICGRLTNVMQVENGARFSLQGTIHPRCEPELAFLLGKPLAENVSAAETLAAIAAVAPAIEIIDSRYRQFRFSLTDVIADNASSTAFVVGDWIDCTTHVAPLNDLSVTLRIDGQLRQSGSTADILGDPLLSLVAAARLAAQSGAPLKAGDIVLAGAATPAEALVSGSRIEAVIDGLGAAGFYVA
ncbi:fumarylacetoacetate hydrolase family protein [Janthinobacterium sp. 17J80-10]|uniref:2-keto-4-pentenoate hydratase n=1 Tax=Janthinobacterium sp. 17J80-10 TaxID=2497863 RepID=UPI001F50BA2C|nr:fumarylacetoacetate hydrolase family protein [Janthinobacterium sp. 17J80-10]